MAKKQKSSLKNYSSKASERAALWNKNHADRRREIRLKWDRDNRDKQKAYREAHKVEAVKYAREWARENRETVNERNRAWRLSNPEKALTSSRNYYQNNKFKHAELVRGWRLAHPIEAQLMGHNRRTKMRGKIIKEDIVNWTSRVCGICDSAVGDKFDIDHIIPVSRGGAHVTTNLQLAHPSCNRRKHSKLPAELILQGAR